MRALLALALCCVALPAEADIFKCQVNGGIEFSDKPCSDKAETVTLDVKQPEPEAVKIQQSITDTFREESRVNLIHDLHEKNDALETKIDQLQRERETELDSLRARTYPTEDGRIGTREHGLFEKMNQVDHDYQQQIETLRSQIRLNQEQLNRLYQ